MSSVILQTASRFLLVLLAMYSVFILLRGHNEPGGGFIGGLLVATAFALYALAFTPRAARQMLRVDPRTLIGVGLVAATLSASFALLSGAPLMQGIWLPITLPGDVKLGSVLLFDIGVYLVVLGTTLLILLTLSEVE